MVQAAAFDIIFIQFYNTPTCSAASWVTSNPNYVPGQPFFSAGLTLDAWISFLATTPSSGARVFAGIPGSTSAANTGSYVNVTDMMNFVSAHYCRAKFTGVAIWDATYADRNLVYGLPFYVQAKAALGRASRDSRVQKCVRAPSTQCRPASAILTLDHYYADVYENSLRPSQLAYPYPTTALAGLPSPRARALPRHRAAANSTSAGLVRDSAAVDVRRDSAVARESEVADAEIAASRNNIRHYLCLYSVVDRSLVLRLSLS